MESWAFLCAVTHQVELFQTAVFTWQSMESATRSSPLKILKVFFFSSLNYFMILWICTVPSFKQTESISSKVHFLYPNLCLKHNLQTIIPSAKVLQTSSNYSKLRDILIEVWFFSFNGYICHNNKTQAMHGRKLLFSSAWYFCFCSKKKLQNMHKKLSITNKNIFPLLKTGNTPENIKDLRWCDWAQVYYKVRKIES